MNDATVVILAGGKGARLAPYTTTFPKPLMPIDDMPILEIVLHQLRQCGFTNIVLSVGHLAELIVAFCGSGAKWGLNIHYAREDVPLGTIGPLRLVEKPKRPFIVMNGDLLTDLDYGELYRRHVNKQCLATVATYRREVNISFGVLEYDSSLRITRFVEKPTNPYWVSMGIYVFDPQIVERVPTGRHYGFDDLMKDMLKDSQKIHAYPFDGLWLDIGRPEDYEQAVHTFKTHRDRIMMSGHRPK